MVLEDFSGEVGPLDGYFHCLAFIILSILAHNESVPTTIESQQSLLLGQYGLLMILPEKTSNQDVPPP